MKKLTDYFWEYNATEQAFYVVEKFGDDISNRTGGFSTPELAIDWFRRELDIELEPKL